VPLVRNGHQAMFAGTSTTKRVDGENAGGAGSGGGGGGGLTNPLTEDLDANDYNIVGLNGLGKVGGNVVALSGLDFQNSYGVFNAPSIINTQGSAAFGATSGAAALVSESQVELAVDPLIFGGPPQTKRIRLDSTGIEMQVDGGSAVLINTSEVELKKDLNMNNGLIVNAPFIDSTAAPLTLNCGLGNSITLDGSFITFFQGGGSFASFTPSSFDMNNNNIENVNNMVATGSDNITVPVVLGTPSGALQVQNGGAYIKQDLQVDGNIYCDSINNIRPSGGLYSESSGFSVTNATLTEVNLLGQGASAGTLAVPADTFAQFDSYSFKASGVLSGGSNDSATLKLKSLVNGTTSVELGSILITLTDNGLVDVAWKVEADFNIRAVGGAGAGTIVLSGNFAYTNNNDVVKTYLRTIVNSSVFDTNQNNELQFTYENDATNPLTSIRIDQASFTKWY